MSLRATLRARWDVVIAAAIAAHIVAIVLGQTKIVGLLHLGWRLRWLTLAALVSIALATVILRGVERRLRLDVPLAAAAALTGLALLSRAWQAAPSEIVFSIPDNLGTERALALGAVLFASAALALAGTFRPVAAGVLAAGVAVALAGLLVLLFDRDAAIAQASPQYGARFNGLGGNPNAAAALEALALPFALAAAFRARSRASALAAWGAAALLAGSIVASGSRGGLAAAGAGVLLLVLVVAPPGRRLLAATAVVSLAVAGLVVSQLPQPNPNAAPASLPADRQPPPAPPPPNPYDAQLVRPLAEDVGRPTEAKPFRRTLLGSGGRAAALKGAAEQALDRPLLGYGFGLEEHVFADRYFVFDAVRPENALVGTALQIGLVGVGLLTVLIGSLLLAARPPGGEAAPFAGAAVAGLVLVLSQSFILAAGATATAAFWLCIFAIPAAAATTANER